MGGRNGLLFWLLLYCTALHQQHALSAAPCSSCGNWGTPVASSPPCAASSSAATAMTSLHASTVPAPDKPPLDAPATSRACPPQGVCTSSPFHPACQAPLLRLSDGGGAGAACVDGSARCAPSQAYGGLWAYGGPELPLDSVLLPSCSRSPPVLVVLIAMEHPVAALAGCMQMEVQKDQGVVAQSASILATLSSHVDPEPFYIASAACAGSSGWLYSKHSNPRYALASAGFSLLYLSAGRLLINGHAKTGYDLGSATSLGLLAWMGPIAGVSGANTVLAAVGGVSSVANLIKSYQYRTGKPHEMIEK